MIKFRTFKTGINRMNCLLRLFVAIMFGTVCISLCACHGTKGMEAFEVPDTFDESRTYDITFWAKNDTNKAQTNVYKKAIEDFHTLYPNINVTLKLYTDYSKIYNDVITNISTNTTPNVCITYPDHIATYLSGVNTVVSLDGIMDDPRYGFGGSELKYDGPAKDEVIGKFLDEGILNDRHYALPYMRSTEALYINKDMVEALGYTVPDVLTWDFVYEVSEKAMEKNADGTYKINKDNVLIPFIYKSTDNMMIQSLKQLDAPYSSETGEVLMFNDTTSSILKEVASHAESGAFSTFKISSYPANFLNAGQCIFAVDSTAGATWMGTEAPLCDIAEEEIVPFETVVRMVPQYDANNPKMISQGPSICIFNKSDSGEVLASWLFAQFLLTNDVQIGYAKTEGYVPVTTKARETREYIDYLSSAGIDNDEHYDVKIEATKMLLDNTDNTFVTPVFNGSASVRQAAGEMIEVVTKSVRRKKTVDDEFITKTYEDVSNLYKLGEISTTSGAKRDLGPLPGGAVALLVTLGCVWVLIGIYFVWDKKKHSKK